MKTLFFLAIPFLSMAQNDSIPIGKVIYQQYCTLEGCMETNGTSVLLFNVSNSFFVHKGVQRKDSSYMDPRYVYPVNITGDPEGLPILKLHQSCTLYQKIHCRTGKCVVSDTACTINWTLMPEKKRLGIYECQRATGHYRGRDYEAWYALDIPIPSGPFKFGGLPGLILEISSVDAQVRFLFDGIVISKNLEERIKMPSGKQLGQTYANFIKEDDEFHNYLVKEMKAKGHEVTITRAEGIELNSNN